MLQPLHHHNQTFLFIEPVFYLFKFSYTQAHTSLLILALAAILSLLLESAQQPYFVDPTSYSGMFVLVIGLVTNVRIGGSAKITACVCVTSGDISI